jgi:hypothetical protein
MNFRQWVQEKWYEHLAELESYGLRPQFTSQQYFNTYKHWLRREYRYQTYSSRNIPETKSVL